ncbi:hypothetical protein KEM54_005601 [Ascosphaera aggregata]|nr:hypothetical protein KEM54_005601 [Ascosphaera aggregata]
MAATKIRAQASQQLPFLLLFQALEGAKGIFTPSASATKVRVAFPGYDALVRTLTHDISSEGITATYNAQCVLCNGIFGAGGLQVYGHHTVACFEYHLRIHDMGSTYYPIEKKKLNNAENKRLRRALIPRPFAVNYLDLCKLQIAMKYAQHYANQLETALAL